MKYNSTYLTGAVLLSSVFLSTNLFGQCSPDVTPPVISCPADIVVDQDPGVCGAIINYTLPSATDNCDVDTTVVYTYTGAMETFTVPAGITNVYLECWGAQGLGEEGGLGGYAAGDLATTGGEVLNIFVGGQELWNGGGAGVADASPKHGGDGSDIRLGGTTLADRIIVAGGGGGGGNTDLGPYAGGAGGGGTVGANYAGGGGGDGYGGAGTAGGASGGTGNSSCHSGGAGGGGFTAGGQGSCSTCYSPHCADDGALGQGGDGSAGGSYPICYSSYGGVAGGGGGYYGGGGTSVGYCGSGAAGGGSSYVSSLTGTAMTGGVQTGEGQIQLTYLGAPSTNLISGPASGTLFPVGTTTVTWEATDAAGNTSSCSFTVTVNSTMDVSTTVTSDSVITISANIDSAMSYQWIDCDNGNMAIPGETNETYNPTDNGNYAVAITDTSGCTDTSDCVSIVSAGMDQLPMDGVKIYPSPTKGNYTVELGQNYSSIDVIITDMNGRVVDQYELKEVSQFDGELSAPKGTYVIQILSKERKWISKLVIE